MTGRRQPLAVTSGPRPPGPVETQNARIRTASIVTGIEPESAQSGGYLRGCDGSSVTFRDELGAFIHPQGDGMTHSGGVFAVEAWIAAAPIRREAA